MELLQKIDEYGITKASQLAIHTNKSVLTYKELAEGSDRLAHYLKEFLKEDKQPIVVYGHKHPYMVMCFIACAKSGRAYCPVDTSVPKARLKEIANTVGAKIIIDVEEPSDLGIESLSFSEIQEIVTDSSRKIYADSWVKKNDVFYIIFTSGSTGKPKGVQITYGNLENFTNWMAQEIDNGKKDDKVFLNQAPYSFDLSVMDLYTSLETGATLWSIEKQTQENMDKLMASFKVSDMNVWVSTPSFAELCLSEPTFNENILEQIETFCFCGETLGKNTARQLMERFPKAKIKNFYGPTEATVAVTSVTITPGMLAVDKALPIGKPHSGTEIIIDPKNSEICIKGNTVSIGYYGNEKQTKEVFIEKGFYKTGDQGHFENGQLYYDGRIDNQIKYHGYRIELGDIENNINNLVDIKQAIVVPKRRDEGIKSLVAFVVANEKKQRSFKDVQNIKKRLKDGLPEYMIPKRIKFIDIFPVTNNGKIDRKALEEML